MDEADIVVMQQEIPLDTVMKAKEMALAKGKKQYDKRESLKEKDDKRDMARMFKR